jgi:hypothetical protein
LLRITEAKVRVDEVKGGRQRNMIGIVYVPDMKGKLIPAEEPLQASCLPLHFAIAGFPTHPLQLFAFPHPSSSMNLI